MLPQRVGLGVGTVYHVQCFGADGVLKWEETTHNIVTTVGMNHILNRMFNGEIDPPTPNTGTSETGGCYPGKRIPSIYSDSATYKIGDVVQPTTPNGRFYISATGAVAGSEPSWPTTLGGTVNDGAIDWYEAGAWWVGLKSTRSQAVDVGDQMDSKTNSWTEITDYTESTREVFNPNAATGSITDGRELSNSTVKCQFNINGLATIGGVFLTDLPIKGNTNGVLYGAADFATDRALVSGDTLNVTVNIQVTST